MNLFTIAALFGLLVVGGGVGFVLYLKKSNKWGK